MKRNILMSVLCLLAISAEATFELDDPTQPDESAEPSKPISFLNFGSKTTAKKVIVPAGAELISPVIENNKCIGFMADDSEIAADGTKNNLTLTTYVGGAISSTTCPVPDSDDDDLSITLIETSEGRLFWVDSAKLLEAK